MIVDCEKTADLPVITRFLTGVFRPRAAPLHDHEGFSTARSTKSFVIMAEAYFRSGVR
jgi:hypothetical protein